MPQPLMPNKPKLTVLWRPIRPSRTNTKKRCSFHHSSSSFHAKVGIQERTGVTGTFDLGVQNEAGQRLTVLPKEHTSHSKHPLLTTQEMTLHMGISRYLVNIEMRLIISFAVKDGAAQYSQQKQYQKLTVARIMNSLLQNSDLKWRK